MIKKKSLLLMNVHVLYVLKYKTSKKNICLSVCKISIRTWILALALWIDTKFGRYL